MAEEGKFGKYAVVVVNFGDDCDGFGEILCVKDTFKEAADAMLTDYIDREAENEGYFKAEYTSKTAEIWYDVSETSGCTWKVVAI